MDPPTVVDWERERMVLLDMCVTASRSHLITATALRDWMANADEKSCGALEQKVLFAKISAEEMAALEDLAALGWAVQRRGAAGVVRKYLHHPPASVRAFYEQVASGQPMSNVLALPSDDDLRPLLDDADLQRVNASIAELQRCFSCAATDYLALEGALVRTYNKIKHGFVVVQRIDKVVPPPPPKQWQQNVYVLTEIDTGGRVHYTNLERSVGMLDRLLKVIAMCADAWKELASLVIWLSEKDVLLDRHATDGAR